MVCWILGCENASLLKEWRSSEGSDYYAVVGPGHLGGREFSNDLLGRLLNGCRLRD